MNIKLDENMPGRLVSVLSSLGHNVETVVQEGMCSMGDVHKIIRKMSRAEPTEAQRRKGRRQMTEDAPVEHPRGAPGSTRQGGQGAEQADELMNG